MLRIAARHAQEWNTWGAPDLAERRRSDFEAACEAVGADPRSLHTSAQTLVVMNDSPEHTAAVDPAVWGDRTISGSDQHIVDRLGRYAGLGFDEVIIPDFTLGNSAAQRYEAYQRFHRQIAAQLLDL